MPFQLMTGFLGILCFQIEGKPIWKSNTESSPSPLPQCMVKREDAPGGSTPLVVFIKSWHACFNPIYQVNNVLIGILARKCQLSWINCSLYYYMSCFYIFIQTFHSNYYTGKFSAWLLFLYVGIPLLSFILDKNS